MKDETLPQSLGKSTSVSDNHAHIHKASVYTCLLNIMVCLRVHTIAAEMHKNMCGLYIVLARAHSVWLSTKEHALSTKLTQATAQDNMPSYSTQSHETTNNTLNPINLDSKISHTYMCRDIKER